MGFLATLVVAASAILMRTTHAGYYTDYCGVGQGTRLFLNGNWTYQGIDTANNDTGYWAHECYPDIHMAWGYKYGGYTFYVIVDSVNGGFYGYCGVNNYAPVDCTGYWYIWDGTQWFNEVNYLVHYCYVFDFQDCYSQSYVEGVLKITDTEGYCISDASINVVIDGDYEIAGCNYGMPYYQMRTGTDVYITWNWCYSVWSISSSPQATSNYAECASVDFNDCSVTGGVNIYAYNGGWYEDTVVDISTCEFIATTDMAVTSFNFSMNYSDTSLSPMTTESASTTGYETTPANTDWWTELDICSIGQNLYQGWNGRFTFNDNDEITGLPYWPHSEDWYYDTQFVNGYAYGGQFSNFTLVWGDIIYAYCNETFTFPYSCNGDWIIYDGSDWVLDSDWTVKFCNSITNKTNCFVEDWVSEELGMPFIDEYCVSDTSVYDSIEGTYSYGGCYEGVPYYEDVNTGFYLYFNWYWAEWWFVDTVGADSLFAYCESYNLLNCDSIWAYNFEDSEWQYDTSVRIGVCETEEPTPQPTEPTTMPSKSPTYTGEDTTTTTKGKYKDDTTTTGVEGTPTDGPANTGDTGNKSSSCRFEIYNSVMFVTLVICLFQMVIV